MNGKDRLRKLITAQASFQVHHVVHVDCKHVHVVKETAIDTHNRHAVVLTQIIISSCLFLNMTFVRYSWLGLPWLLVSFCHDAALKLCPL